MTAQPELIHAGRIPATPGWRIRMHGHEFSEVIVVLAGRMTVTPAGGEPIPAAAGHVLVYPSGCLHEEVSDERAPVETIFLAVRSRPAAAVVRAQDTDGRMRTLARWLLELRDSRQPGAAAMAETCAQLMLQELARLLNATSAPEGLVERSRRFMRDNLRRAISLADLATASNMSRYHFVRVYRAARGVTPMADLRRMRLDEAAGLLRATSLPLKAVAPMVGFANEFHLSRGLKAVLGVGVRKLRAGSDE